MCEIGRYKFKIMFARGPRYDLLLFLSTKKTISYVCF